MDLGARDAIECSTVLHYLGTISAYLETGFRRIGSASLKLFKSDLACHLDRGTKFFICKLQPQ